jgi:hypothetical protein
MNDCFVTDVVSYMPESAQSPLARLVLFVVCLSIAGSFVAGAHYVMVDLPAQNAQLQAPTNGDTCSDTCYSDYMSDLKSNCGGTKNYPFCGAPYWNTYQTCLQECAGGMR